jgi:hypothetical protein
VDLWVWIAIFIAAWLLEALSAAAKNKRRQQQPQQPLARRPAPPAAAPSRPPPIVEVPVARPPRPREAEATAAAEGVSAEAEVVEAAPESTDASHARVVEKYRAPAVGEIGGPEAPARARGRLVLRPATVRDAVVWREILGPPKSER